METESLVFSVLICTYQRPEQLKAALRALIECTEEKPDQIVVVNGGDERSDQVVQAYKNSSKIQIELIRTKNVNLATSRNIGLQYCTGDIIAMTDDDAEVFADWVTNMKIAHSTHPEAGAVGGMVVGTNSHTLLGRVADVITFPVWKTSCYVRTLPGVNVSYKRDVIRQIGFQDETLFRGEDVDFNWRVKKTGYEIFFDPSIRVYHHHRPNLRAFLNQHFMYGRAYYLVRSKWKDMYCVYPHGIRSIKDILKVINFFVAPIYQPILSAARMPLWTDKIVSVPLLILADLSWKSGMIIQRFWFSNKKKK